MEKYITSEIIYLDKYSYDDSICLPKINDSISHFHRTELKKISFRVERIKESKRKKTKRNEYYIDSKGKMRVKKG